MGRRSWLFPDDELESGQVHRHRIAGPGNAQLVAVERTRATAGFPWRRQRVRVAVAQDRRDVTGAARDFATDMLPYLGFLALFLIGAAYAQIAIGLRPLAHVRDQINAIRQGRLRRLGNAFPLEIKPLASEVDAAARGHARRRWKRRGREPATWRTD